MKKFISLEKRGIFFKIISSMIIVSLLPIFVLAFYLNKISEDSIRESVATGFQNISKRTEQEINLFFNRTEGLLKSTSDFIVNIQFDEWKARLVFSNQMQEFDGLEAISFFDLDGKEIISSHIGERKTNNLDKAFFENALKGNTSYSNIRISDDYPPTMKIAVPVKKLNKIIGVLIADINVRYLWELVDNIRIGKTGHAYIIDSTGIVIAHPERERILKYEKFINIPIIQKTFQKGSSTCEYINETGKKVLGSSVIIPNLKWIIVVEQPVEEAFSLVTKIRQTTIILALIAIFLAVIAGYFKSAKIVTPIKELTNGAKKIARGDLEHAITINSNDEIGDLTNSFNSMTVALKNVQNELIRKEKLALLGQMSSKIAHEVGNPLEAIKGANEFLRDNFRENEVIRELTEINIQEVNKLINFVSLVLISGKKVELNFTETNINSVFENIFSLVLNDTRFKKITIYKDFDDNMPIALFDPDHLQRAFLNVVINSMQAISREGKLRISTSFVNHSTEKFIKISIQDNGSGMSPLTKKNLFAPFYTTKRTGTGLGLSYFHEVIKGHKGEIEVESEETKGTTFFINLPYRTPIKQEQDFYDSTPNFNC